MANKIRASHILLMHDESDGGGADRTRADALKEIEEIKRRLGAGEDFADDGGVPCEWNDESGGDHVFWPTPAAHQ